MYSIFCFPEATYLTWSNVYGMKAKGKIIFAEKQTAELFISIVEQMRQRKVFNPIIKYATRKELFEIMEEPE